MGRGENSGKISNLDYFSDLVCGQSDMVLEIIDTFLTQIIEESEILDDAISKADYKNIKTNAHSMKSTLSIIGATTLLPILVEIENLALQAKNIQNITILKYELDVYIKQVVKEIEEERGNYI